MSKLGNAGGAAQASGGPGGAKPVSALDQVIEWAEKEIPDWQSDAVRRILSKGNVTRTDFDEILLMIKAAHGIDGGESAPKPIKLASGHASGSPSSPVPLILKMLDKVSNVNAIPNNSYIPFGHEGVTIIYGENGAGKSGFVRVMKKACSAMDDTEQILPNVLTSGQSGQASAIFKISVDGKPDQEIPWVNGTPSNDILSNIVVFDSKGARVIIDEDNDVSFLPYGTHIFEPLVKLLKDLHEKLESEKPKPKKPEYADIPPTTSSGAFMRSISVSTTESDIANATKWSEDDEKASAALSSLVADAGAPDKHARLNRMRTAITSLKELLVFVSNLEKVLSEEAIGGIRIILGELHTTESALGLVASRAGGNEPLAGVGGDVWQIMYLAAKTYSEKMAYPGKAFPVLEEESRCVLCMQPLVGEGRERFQRFFDFMDQTIKKQKDEAIARLAAAKEKLEGITFESYQADTSAIQEVRNKDAAKCQEIEAYIASMKKRFDLVIAGIGSKDIGALDPLLGSPIGLLGEIIKGAELEYKSAESAMKPEELAKARGSLLEYSCRNRLASNAETIKAYVSELRKAKKFEEAIAATNIVAASARGKKIISNAVTPFLRKALSDEFSSLGASHLPLDMKPTRADGETVYKFILTKGALPGRAGLTSVLSEGEQRVVAIAGFLAEIGLKGVLSPIVLDDPISSLDHKFRFKVAARLAEEGKKRQVIIFTHDIAFMLDIIENVTIIGNVKLSSQTIRRKNDIPGISAIGLPWHAMPLKERIDFLRKKLAVFAGEYSSNKVKYNEEAANLYGLLRDSWEVFVEEIVLNKVVRRHGAEVQTKRLMAVEVTTDLYVTLDRAMGKCSTWMIGHAQARGLDVDRPSPKEIGNDMDELARMHSEVNKKSEKVASERRDALKPPQAKVG